MKHGGDLLTYKDKYEGDLVDFSSNINPLGLPDGLKEELMEAVDDLKSYPDIKYRSLKKAVSSYLNCHSDNVVLGNGAVEIIDNFISLAERVIISTPSFGEYKYRALIHGKEIIDIPYISHESPDIGLIGRDLQAGDMVVLGNPNNPSGMRLKQGDLISIYQLVKKAGAYLLLDEAFFEFCPEDYDSIDLFKDDGYSSVGIIRAATKFFALPGIRLGYGCACPLTVGKIENIKLPWSVNTLAEKAGTFVFKDEDYIKKSKAYIEKERTYLLSELKKIKSIEAFNSQANFVLIRLLSSNEDEIFKYFLSHGLVLRKCSSFDGLDDSFIRIAIKDRKNNNRIIDLFKKWDKEF